MNASHELYSSDLSLMIPEHLPSITQWDVVVQVQVEQVVVCVVVLVQLAVVVEVVAVVEQVEVEGSILLTVSSLNCRSI